MAWGAAATGTRSATSTTWCCATNTTTWCMKANGASTAAPSTRRLSTRRHTLRVTRGPP
jgi:hypothetical protein